MGTGKLCSICRRIVLVLLVLTFTLLSQWYFSPAYAQPQKPAGLQSYPVMLDGRQILTIKVGTRARSPEERAAAISERIRKLADDRSTGVNAVMVEENEEYSAVVADDRVIMGVYSADAGQEGMARADLAEMYAHSIREAISRYRSEYSVRSILIGACLAALSILAALVLLWLLGRLSARARTVIEVRFAERIKGLRIQSLELIRADRVKALVLGFLKTVKLIIALVITYACLHSIFAFFPWTRGFAAGLLSYVLIPIKMVGSGIVHAIPNLIVLVVIVIVTRYVLKVLHLVFENIERGAISFPGFDAEWAPLTHKLARLLFIIFVVIVAFPYIPGADTPIFKGISIFVGVLFSLGSQSALSNIIAGVALIYRRAFKVGDRIKINDIIGDVTELKLQTTRLRTVKNESVIIPNGVILNSNVINYTELAREKGLILHTQVTIGYDAPWRQVHAMLLTAAAKTSGLLKEPQPFVLQRSLDDFFVTYELNAYTDTPENMLQFYSDLHQNIQDVFNEYGVQIMSPHYIGDKPTPTYVPREHWYDPPAGTD